MEKSCLDQLDRLSGTHDAPRLVSWKTGFWRRLPRTGLLALVAATVTSASMVYIIVASHDQPIGSWKYQPTVCLAITYTIANIALQYALARAITVAWWVKALKGDASVRDLHNIWSFGNGVGAILFSGRSFNLVALAGLAVTLAPINGPLLQRASVISERTRLETKTVTIPIAEEFTRGFTGEITGRQSSPASLTPAFSDLLKQYNNLQPVNIMNSGCNGFCKGTVLGAGYDISCLNDTIPYDITGAYKSLGKGVYKLDFDFFWLNFTYEEVDNAVINFTTVFKAEPTCEGSLTRTRCILRPATIEYPFLLMNDTITFGPENNWRTDRISVLPPLDIAGSAYRGPTTHGGMWLYLNELYKSHVWTGFGGIEGWKSWTSGTTGFRYVNNMGRVNSHEMSGGCNITFFDPTPDVMNVVRDIAFRTALHIPITSVEIRDAPTGYPRPISESEWNDMFLHQIEAQQSMKEIIYESQYKYLAIAFAITLIATLCVLVVFSGWWHLGHDVSLSPIEIAKAFDAPLLSSAELDENIGTLLQRIGGRRLRYGAVWNDDAGYSERATASLRFNEAGLCEKPQDGQVFGF